MPTPSRNRSLFSLATSADTASGSVCQTLVMPVAMVIELVAFNARSTRAISGELPIQNVPNPSSSSSATSSSLSAHWKCEPHTPNVPRKSVMFRDNTDYVRLMPILSSTDLTVSRLCLGGNVFGWTADEDTSFAVLDAYLDAGGNFIDTADVYSAWADGNSGGESETIIGKWLARRDDRDRIVVATKVGMLAGFKNQKRETILSSADRSLKRLGVDHIDLYYNHLDDPTTQLEETLAAYDQL